MKIPKYDNDDYVGVADKIAEKRHEGQFRKDGKTPYITHPREAAEVMKECGVEDKLIISATLLHDVLEDCPGNETKLFLDITKEGISPDKAAAIVNMVAQMTNPDKQMNVSPLFNRKMRKAIMARHFKYVSPEVAMIKIADRFCNIKDLKSIKNGDAEFEMMYASETIKLMTSIRTRVHGINEDVRDNFVKLCDNIESICTKIINEHTSNIQPSRNR